MTVEAIAAAAAEVTSQSGVSPAQPTAAGFSNWFTQELGQVNASLMRADVGVRALAAGQPVALHQVMLDLEEARLSFQLLAQVRNRVLEAYQEVMRTQV